MKTVTTELVVLSVRGGALEALLVRLPGNRWRLPGGPVESGVPVDAACRAALAEQTGVRGIVLEQLYSFDRDGGEGLCVAQLALVAADRHPLAPGPGVVEARWFPLGTPGMPVLDDDSAAVLAYGLARIRAKAAYAPIALHLLPEEFTLGELQAAYEAILGHALDTRNFRRDVLAGGVVQDAGTVRAEGPGRPARLYRSAGGDFQVSARERRIARAIAAR